MGKLPWAASLLGHAGLLTGLALVATRGAPPAPRVSLTYHNEPALDEEPVLEEVLPPPDPVAEPREVVDQDEPDPPRIEVAPVDCVEVAWPTPVGRGLTMRLRKPLKIRRRKKAAPAAAPAIRAPRRPPTGPTRSAQPIRGGAGIVYPPRARRRGLEGVVLLRLDISPAGAVTAVEILTSSGHPILDVAARRAAWKWSFRPALVRGCPKKSTLTRRIRFRLR